ncbi:hypothetical protein BEP19_09890 [Ammoniphilus oxalaticus]|uniref:Uncharacterized protein n=1 Tax=Ammoniphilus oxalaticus TaxID=66863 RepID=A0A419SFJ9_9BACL|nr:hypothetical protein [Ammoniphilus oxalaticus]RKD22562.1 hypothetical protein BEP19_09890 [Ammoniphilus oxalaticus]
MSDKVEVVQNSQRNLLDVATELTLYTAKANFITDPEELKKLYSEFYALAKAVGSKHSSLLDEFIPEEILSKIKR